MIFDIHSHLLPFVDDGSPDMRSSVKLVRDQLEDGVTELVLTPHYRLDWVHEPKERIREVYEDFKAALKDEGISVRTHLGQEAHDAPGMFECVTSGKVLTLSGTEYFLLELDWHVQNKRITETVSDYIHAGFIPVIVHYERFPYKTMEEVRALRALGALFQINAYSLLGAESERNREFAFSMLEEGVVDFIATDYHLGKFRKTKEAYELIGARYGTTLRDDLFYLNAKKLFSEDR